jgi:hypothetical protein
VSQRRNRRSRLRSGNLTLAQSEVLSVGIPFSTGIRLIRNSGGPVAETTDEQLFSSDGARASWERHRKELLQAAMPGTRPTAFYEFDLGIAPPGPWWNELAVLSERHLLMPEECMYVERIYGVLDPKQSFAFCSAFEHPEQVREMRFGPVSLRLKTEEFAFASKWHAERGRLQLAEAYRRRAEACCAISQGGSDA